MENMVQLDQKKEVEEDEREEKEEDDGTVVEEDRAEKVKEDGGIVVEEDRAEKVKEDDGTVVEQNRAEEVKEDGGIVVEENRAEKVKEDGGIVVEENRAEKVKEDDGTVVEEGRAEKVKEDDGSEEEEDRAEEDDRAKSRHENDEENTEEEITQVLDKPKKIINLSLSPKEHKQSDVLNLNNEVVKMRKEVKRVRALLIRKLTRKIATLKKKKGKDREIARNQQRADRLLEEIHVMKTTAPDLVTKMALQKHLNFEQVCKNPKSTISDRAVARIASHPQFDKKILAIKTAIKAFKEERMKNVDKKGNKKALSQTVKVNPQSPDRTGESDEGDEEEEESSEEQTEQTFNAKEEGTLKGVEGTAVAKPETETVTAAGSANSAVVLKKETPSSESVKLLPVKISKVRELVKGKPQRKQKEKKSVVPQKAKDEEESDLESSDDEEKEYFDDSTEERFRKQSSQSEDSDDDDFFVGKVSKFKKKSKEKESELGEKTKQEVKNDLTDKVRTELDDLEARLKSKAPSMQSVFCSSLSRPMQSRGGGAGRGRGWAKIRGQGKMKGGPNRDFSRESKFPKQEERTERNSGFKYSKPEGTRAETEKGFASFGRGRGRGRGDVMKHKDHRGGGVFTHQAPKQTLHPSWEASKKRKEQQGQIQAFQGKKIKFDDD